MTHPTINQTHNDPLLTETETAQLLKVKPQTLAKWRMGRSETQIPYVKVGRSIRYRLSALNTHLDSNTFCNTVEAHHSNQKSL